MAILFDTQVIYAKTESSYGSDASPTGSTSAILTSGLSITHYGGNTVSRDFDTPNLGNSSVINTGPFVTLSFSVEAAGSGTAGTAPSWTQLLEACCIEHTNTPSTSDAYAPELNSESVTIYYEWGSEQQIITGARGTCSITLARGEIPKLNFTFTGLYAAPTTATTTGRDVSGFTAPIPVTKDNTPTTTFDSYTAVMESFTLDLGNTVVPRNLPGSESVLITQRQSTWAAVIEEPAIATKNFHALARSDASVQEWAFSIVHGTAAGNIITLASSYAQIADMSISNSDGIRMLNMSGPLSPSDSGNDEFSITLT